MGDSGGDLESGATDSAAQRQRLLQGTARLEDGSRRLEESNRIALETEDLGADILRDLRGQREQIENARDTVSGRPSDSLMKADPLILPFPASTSRREHRPVITNTNQDDSPVST